VGDGTPGCCELGGRLVGAGLLESVQPSDGEGILAFQMNPGTQLPQRLPGDHAVLMFAEHLLQVLGVLRQRRRWCAERRLDRLARGAGYRDTSSLLKAHRRARAGAARAPALRTSAWSGPMTPTASRREHAGTR